MQSKTHFNFIDDEKIVEWGARGARWNSDKLLEKCHEVHKKTSQLENAD